MALFLTAAVLVALWIMQITFTDERETILADRAEVAASYSASHPYRYRDVIEAAAEANNLHPAFVAAIVLNESSFNPSAESDVGARGLMQMMPETAKWVHDKIDTGTEYSFDLMWDAETNVKYACWYLAYLSERFSNDPILVSAAFHAGQTTVQNWLNDSRYSADNRSITLENMVDGPTKSYAARVTKAFAVYRRLYYEATETTSVIASDPLASLIASTVRSVKGMIEGGLHAESDVASEAVDASSETLAASSEALSASNSRKRRARRI